MSPGSQATGSLTGRRPEVHGRSARMPRCHPPEQAAPPPGVRIR